MRDEQMAHELELLEKELERLTGVIDFRLIKLGNAFPRWPQNWLARHRKGQQDG